MLGDAFAAERIRLLKARGTLFWSLAPVPVIYLAWMALKHIGFHSAAAKTGSQAALSASGPIDLVVQALGAVNGPFYVMVIPFLLIAGSSILATDYRWETWRLLTPRNTRTNLMLAKLGTFGVVALVGLLLLVAVGFIGGVFGSVLNAVPLVFSAAPDAGFKQLLMVVGLGWLELIVFGAAAACLAVFTRSQFATFFITLMWAVVQGVWQLVMRAPDPANPPIKYLALLPGYSADFLKSIALGGWMASASQSTWYALGFLTLWAVALTALAVVLFNRQDLTRE